MPIVVDADGVVFIIVVVCDVSLLLVAKPVVDTGVVEGADMSVVVSEIVDVVVDVDDVCGLGVTLTVVIVVEVVEVVDFVAAKIIYYQKSLTTQQTQCNILVVVGEGLGVVVVVVVDVGGTGLHNKMVNKTLEHHQQCVYVVGAGVGVPK
jgi:hypothetical protein